MEGLRLQAGPTLAGGETFMRRVKAFRCGENEICYNVEREDLAGARWDWVMPDSWKENVRYWFDFRSVG